MRVIFALFPATFALSGCFSPFSDAATGYNLILNEISSAEETADQLPTNGSATYEGHLLLSAYGNSQASGDFLGDARIDASFNVAGAALSGQVTDFFDSETEEAVAGSIALTNGVLDRTASITDPNNPGSTHSMVVNADGTLTKSSGDTFAFDSVIYGDVVGQGASLLSGTVSGDVLANGAPANAGGTLVARER